MAPPPARLACDDRGSIVFGWLTRLTLILVLLGLIGFEVLSIVVTRVAIQDTGQTAGLAALDEYRASRNPATAYQTASASAEAEGATIAKKSFEITDESVTFKIQKVAPTLVLYRTDTSASWAHVSTTVYVESLESGGAIP